MLAYLGCSFKGRYPRKIVSTLGTFKQLRHLLCVCELVLGTVRSCKSSSISNIGVGKVLNYLYM